MTEGVPRAAWAQLSRHYDRQLWLERAAVRTALDLVRPGPDDRLVDVGTGTGVVLRELAARPVRPRHAVGVDASAAMLDRVPDLPRRWTLREGDACNLPFSANAFDLAVASYLLHVLPESAIETALSELARVLTPGGRLVTVTPVVPARGFLRPMAIAADALARCSPERFGGLRAFDPRPDLERAGFALIRARTSLRGYPSLCVLARAPGA